MLRRLEQIFESALWASRLVVLVAVVASLFVALAVFYVATVDVVDLLMHVGEYGQAAMSTEAKAELRARTITHVVEVIDGYLLATILLIFAFGLYELFISRIDAAEGNELAARVLLIRNLDDLKDRLAKVVLLILVVKFFEHALGMKFEKPLDLVYLTVGIALTAGAIHLSHASHHKP